MYIKSCKLYIICNCENYYGNYLLAFKNVTELCPCIKLILLFTNVKKNIIFLSEKLKINLEILINKFKY